jgi:hypothetical protein
LQNRHQIGLEDAPAGQVSFIDPVVINHILADGPEATSKDVPVQMTRFYAANKETLGSIL